MNIRPFLSAAIILLIVVMTTPLAAAQEGEWYVGGSLGSSDDDVLDQTASSFKVFGGYQFTRNLGVEIALVDLGEFDSLGLPNALEQWGLAYGIVGILSIGDNGSVFGKAGLFDWSVDFLSRTVDEGTDLTPTQVPSPPTNAANSSSNDRTSGPRINCPELRTRSIAASTCSLRSSYCLQIVEHPDAIHAQ